MIKTYVQLTRRKYGGIQFKGHLSASLVPIKTRNGLTPRFSFTKNNSTIEDILRLPTIQPTFSKSSVIMFPEMLEVLYV